MAGSSCGKVIWRNVRHGVANRSALASTSERSIPDSRARTSSSDEADVEQHVRGDDRLRCQPEA